MIVVKVELWPMGRGGEKAREIGRMVISNKGDSSDREDRPVDGAVLFFRSNGRVNVNVAGTLTADEIQMGALSINGRQVFDAAEPES